MVKLLDHLDPNFVHYPIVMLRKPADLPNDHPIGGAKEDGDGAVPSDLSAMAHRPHLASQPATGWAHETVRTVAVGVASAALVACAVQLARKPPP